MYIRRRLIYLFSTVAMILKKIQHLKSNDVCFAVLENDEWKIIKNHAEDFISLLEKTNTLPFNAETISYEPKDYQELIPFLPASFRDFMLYEKHAIDAARGFVKKFMPNAFPFVSLYEKLSKKTFPLLKPHALYYKHPIFYMGNHLNFFTNEEAIEMPIYTNELDYELEIAALITKPLKNAHASEVEDAIGGFVILNDFSARNRQLQEMKSGFGPMKTKNFANAISCTIATREPILSKIEDLSVRVIINDELITENRSFGKIYSFQEAIAYASWGEQLHPGELFGSGTIPGCTGIENGKMLKKGDSIRLEVDGIGHLKNHIL